MAEMEQSGERTHEPTALRVEEARRAGNFARSADLVAIAGLLAAMVVLGWTAREMLEGLVRAMRGLLDARATGDLSIAGIGQAASHAALPLAGLAAIVAAAAVGTTLAVGFLQGRMAPSMEQVKLDWSRLSLSGGLARMFSRRGVVRVLLAVGKIVAAGAIAFGVLRAALPDIVSGGVAACAPSADAATSPATPTAIAMQMAMQTGALAWQLAIQIAVALLVLSALDYLYQRWEHRQSLKMSRRELMDELKRTEGDSQVRSRRKQLGRNLTGKDRRLVASRPHGEPVMEH